MAAILLDVDGVLHVSGQPLPGAADAVRRLREAGHRLRFVTNATTRAKADLAAGLQSSGIDLDVTEVQTTADAAVEALRGRRVLALVMHALVGDLDEIELVGDNVDAVLIGGADDSPETNLVFSYMNLARAFAELEMGADLYCLHRNRWWQTARGPLLDSGCYVAGLEYAAQTAATVLGKPSAAYFDAACRGARRRTFDDLDGRRRSRDRCRRRAGRGDARGACANRQVPAGRRRDVPDPAGRDRLLDRDPARVARGAHRVSVSVGTDLIEIERIRRSLARYARFRERCFTEAERAYCDSRPNPAQSYAGRFAGKEAVGKALGFGVARAFAWQEVEIVGRPKPAVRLSGRLAERAAALGVGSVDLSMTHSRELAQAVAIAVRWLSSSRSTRRRRCAPPRRATTSTR